MPDESWFDESKPRRVAAPILEDSLLPVVPPKDRGSLEWALGLGFFGGAAGGAAMVFVADWLARRYVPGGTPVAGTIGQHVPLFEGDAFAGAMAVGIVIGAALGVPIGALLRYTLRMVARLLAGGLLAPVLWILVHAFVLKSFAPRLASLPIGPMLAGAAVYGLCLALLRPPRALPKLDTDD